MFLLHLLVGCCASWGPGDERPAAMQAFEQARRGIISGRIEWTRVDYGAQRGPHSMRHVSRYARNGDVILELRGDEEGWVIFDPSGEPLYKHPQMLMQNKDGYWEGILYQGTVLFKNADPTFTPWGDDRRRADYRFVGIIPDPNTMDTLRGFADAWSHPSFPIESWSQERHGNRYTVTAHITLNRSFTWEIDADKGWNATRVTFEHEGYHAHVEHELVETGGVWLPKRSDFYVNGELKYTINADAIAINQPDDPGSFDGNDIGLLAGCAVGTHGSSENFRWDSERLVPEQEWLEDNKAGRKKSSPLVYTLWGHNSPYCTERDRQQFRLSVAAAHYQSAVGQHVSMWERYVRDFITKYRLSESQAVTAMHILRQCQESAAHYLSRKETDINSVYSQLQQAIETKDEPRREAMQQRLQELTQPIRDIFKDRLKPKLEKLPTKKQREAADKREIEKLKALEKKAAEAVGDAGSAPSAGAGAGGEKKP